MSAKSTRRACAPALRLLLLALAAAATAQAAAQDDAEARYRALVGEAITEYEARDFPAARALFLRAHALSGNARTLRGLGMVAFELRDYTESVERLEQALGARERPLEGALRADTEALLARARTFVARLELHVEPAVTVEVRIDGVEAALDGAQRLLVAVGDHTVEAAAPGFAAQRRTITVVGGRDQTLHVQLSKLETAGTATAPSAERAARAGFASGMHRDPRLPQRAAADTGDAGGGVLSSAWFWTAAGLVIGGGVAAALLLATSGDEVEPPLEPRSGVSVNALEFAP